MWPFQISINLREAVGATLVVVALILMPVAWMWSRRLWFVAGVLLLVGFILFFSRRIVGREGELEKEAPAGGGHGPPVPSDIHNYTGWRHGGRSETMDSESGAEGD